MKIKDIIYMAVLISLIFSGKSFGEECSIRTIHSAWAKGDWWLTKNIFVVSIGRNPTISQSEIRALTRKHITSPDRYPGEMSDYMSDYEMQFLYKVDNKTNINNELCFVIKVYIHSAPDALKINPKGEALYTLYMREKDSKLVKVEWFYEVPKNTRFSSLEDIKNSPYIGSSAIKASSTYVSIDIPKYIPLEIPSIPEKLWPAGPMYRFHLGDAERWVLYIYKKNKKYNQILLSGKLGNGCRFTQVWNPNYPWHVAWLQIPDFNYGFRQRLYRSYLIEFGNKDQKPGKGTKVPTLFYE